MKDLNMVPLGSTVNINKLDSIGWKEKRSGGEDWILVFFSFRPMAGICKIFLAADLVVYIANRLQQTNDVVISTLKKEYEDYMRANTRFRNKESDEHRIEGFRKEFYQNLLEIKNRE